MPNIIEQQDLLKGLPDTRLATLLQNPVADIPPFLVAAEAQRRQAIRQQFAGSEGKESVVDSLTKQLANVPQNISAPPKTAPMIPPTPQMQGVAALQAQQGGEQEPPQGGQQAMRGGGMVQRYQAQGLVQSVGNRVQAIADQFGVTVEEAAQMMKNNPSIGAPSIEADLGKPFYVPETNQEPRASPSKLNLPVLTESIENYEKSQRELARESKYQEMDSYPGYSGNMTSFTPPDMKGMSAEEVMRDLEAQRRKTTEQKAQPISDIQQEPGETPDEFRARYEELLAAQQPSDWEKAQRYFAMAEQFLDPSKTTMQSVAGAGQAFAQSAADQARAQREAEFNLKKGLLEYDMAERDRLRSAEAERAQREYDSLLKREERSVVSAKEAMGYFGTEIKALYDQMKDIDENMMITPEEKKLAKDSIQSQIDSYRLQASFLMKNSGYNTGNVITYEQLKASAGQQ